MHLVNGTGKSPSPARSTPGVVKQDKSSRGSVDTTKTRSGPQRVRMSSGERPIGAAKGKQPNSEAPHQTPPLGGGGGGGVGGWVGGWVGHLQPLSPPNPPHPPPGVPKHIAWPGRSGLP